MMRRRGFTLMELLIAMGIIAALTALALPLFIDQLNHWRRETDIQTARDGYAAAQAEWLMGKHTPDDILYYDSGSGAISLTPPTTSYGKWDHEADYTVAGTVVGGNAAQAGFISFSFNSDGTLSSAAWGDADMGLWRSLVGTLLDEYDWYDSFNAGTHVVRSAAFERLHNISNSVRRQSDIRILRALAGYFEGMSVDEAKEILGDTRWVSGQRNSGTKFESMLFEYGQDGGGSIRISALDTEYVPYFAGIGYDAKIFKTQGGTETWALSDDYVTGGYNYVNKYLFTSDEMLGTAYQNSTFHNVNISFDIVDDHIENVVISISDLSAAGFTSAR